MTARLTAAVMLLALLTACGTTRMVRLKTGQGEPLLHLPHTNEAPLVKLGEEEFTQGIGNAVRQRRLPANPERAARELFDVPLRSGWYGYSPLQGVVPLDEQPSASGWRKRPRAATPSNSAGRL